MIIQAITLTDFGPYRGRTTIDLTVEPNKPVILFGALNGGGKTTLLDAFKLTLYGRKCGNARMKDKKYEEYLRACINRDADPLDGARISVEFKRTTEGREDIVKISRYWCEGPEGAIEESVLVERNGMVDPSLSGQGWDPYMHSCLPSSLAGLFFFDGEQIKQFADNGEDGAKAILRDSISFLLGLDTVEKLNGDLENFEARISKTKETPDQRIKRGAIEAELSVLKAALIEKEAMLEIRDKDVQARILDQERIYSEFKLKGGETFKNKSAIESDLKEKKSALARAHEQLIALSSGHANLLLLIPSLQNLQRETERDNKASKDQIAITVIRERDTALVKFIEENGPDKFAKNIRAWLKDDLSHREDTATKSLGLLCPESLPSEISLVTTNILPELKDKIAAAVSSHDSIELEIESLERQLASVPSADYIGEIEARLAAASKAADRAKAERDITKAEHEHAERAYNDKQGELNSVIFKGLDEKQAVGAAARMATKSKRAREILAAFKTQLLTLKLGAVEDLILQGVTQLMRKEGLITRIAISAEDFSLGIWGGPEAKPVQYEHLSEGERQMLITSIIWALAKTSGKLFPLFVDTPLSRLDSKHRGQLAEKFYPEASHQVIIFSTDSEFVGEHLKAISKYVGKFYLLTNDGKSGSKISNTYFN